MSRAKRAPGGIGRTSVAFGTAIVVAIPGKRGLFTCLDSMRLTAAGTAHTATVLKDWSRTTLTANAAAAQAVINLAAALTDADGNAMAVNDHVAVELADGTWHNSTIASIATLAVTLNANLPSAAKLGGAVVGYGAPADTNNAKNTFNVPASATTQIPAAINDSALIRSRFMNSPLIISDNNITATGAIEDVQFSYDDGR